MNREQLKALGLTDEQITSVMTEHGKTVEAQKAKAVDLQASVTDLTGQLTQRDTDLKALKGKADVSETLKTELTTLQTKYDTETADFATKLKDTHQTSALRLALTGKVHDVDMVIGQIDRDKIKVDADGKITEGLDDQVKSLAESKSFLFVPDSDGKPHLKGVKPGESNPGGAEPKAGDYGKNLAEALAKNKQGLDEARKSYFD